MALQDPWGFPARVVAAFPVPGPWKGQQIRVGKGQPAERSRAAGALIPPLKGLYHPAELPPPPPPPAAARPPPGAEGTRTTDWMTWLCKQTSENKQNHSACHGRVPGFGNAESRKGGAERHQEATGKEELGQGSGT